MKRDMELIRSIMLFVEEHDYLPVPIDVGTESDIEIAYQVILMQEAGFLPCALAVDLDDGRIDLQRPRSLRLTWEGHDFIDSARDETVWKKAIEKTKSVSGSAAFVVFVSILKDIAMERIQSMVGGEQ